MFDKQNEIKGWCLQCGNSFSGNPHASLCPDCLIKEFKNMDKGCGTGYLYAALEYRKYRYNSEL